MIRHKKFGSKLGFTLIEVSLFLAITGLLFMGVIMGTQNALRDQRFYDSTQNFVEFLKSVYSQVANPQSRQRGNSEKYAIYGKLVVFGQNTGLDGSTVNSDGIQRAYVYDVVGNAVGTGTGDVLSMMRGLNADVVVLAPNGKSLDYAGLVEDYVPRWDAQIEFTSGHTPFKGTILIVRHPNSGTINTLVSSGVLQVNSAVKTKNAALAAGGTYADGTILKEALNWTGANAFAARELDFCINPEGADRASDLRRNIRLTANARNSSGILTLDLDGSENKCRN